jgi:trehalose/maltose hydrolase-like predicted phosphorylase
VEVTGDIDFLVDHGAEIAFEVARFLRSFVRYDDWTRGVPLHPLLGPDEWHENVDDNAFTNYQVHAALTVRDRHPRAARLATRA